MMKRSIKISFGLFVILLLLSFNVPMFKSTVQAASDKQQDATYIVQQGDTLSSITLRFGISLDELLSANDISDPNSVNIGRRLIIPGLEGISGVLTSEVLPFGSTLTGLTRQYELDQNDLVSLNRITSPSETIAGVKFIIPINEDEEGLVPLTIMTKDTTLLEAAIQANTSPWTLIRDNQLSANWDVLPGETLYSNGDKGNTFTIFQDVDGIIIIDLPIIQGETLQVAISTDTTSEFSGKFNNDELYFFTDDDMTYYSFHGIHAMMEPGPYPLEITATLSDGTIQSFEQLVMLSAGAYGDEWVNVPEEYLDESIIIEEDAYLQPILNEVSSEKYWEGRFQSPVDEPLVNSSFGQRRNYNNGVLFFYHTGMDFAVNAPNLNVYAPAAGEVVLAEALTIKGNAILIDHGWGVVSGYWHLSEFYVSAGDFVKPGDIIGQIGNTGRSAGPHLHFEIDITGTPVNPQTWLNQEFPRQGP
ncbi:MAG: peptidoglycan DD-metalloendopeptidase family protein [Chloroflexota bacterium]|nr:peptidoglycan DD-metalloendopeptidase family protein [Chloroflexota bacterium]